MTERDQKPQKWRRETLRQIVSLALGATVVAHTVSAQSLSTVAIGTEMRVRLDESGAVVKGRLAWVRGDSIALQRHPNSEEIRVGISALQSYTLRGRRSRAAGAKRGALIGGGFGLALLATSLSYDLTSEAETNVPSTLYVAPIAVGTTLLGTGIGALIGRKPWQKRVSLIGSLSTEHNRLAISVRF
jgi:hypothetical protein